MSLVALKEHLHSFSLSHYLFLFRFQRSRKAFLLRNRAYLFPHKQPWDAEGCTQDASPQHTCGSPIEMALAHSVGQRTIGLGVRSTRETVEPLRVGAQAKNLSSSFYLTLQTCLRHSMWPLAFLSLSLSLSPSLSFFCFACL